MYLKCTNINNLYSKFKDQINQIQFKTTIIYKLYLCTLNFNINKSKTRWIEIYFKMLIPRFAQTLKLVNV